MSAETASEHRPPDLVGVPAHPFAEWRVPTVGESRDARVVLTQVDARGRYADEASSLMIRAHRLPQGDAPGLIEAIAAAAAYRFEAPS